MGKEHPLVVGRTTGQASQESEKKKKGEKRRGKPIQYETRKKNDPQASQTKKADKLACQQQGEQRHPPRESKHQEAGVPQPAYSPSSQQMLTTQHSKIRSRETQRNIPLTGGAYSSPQSSRHPIYTQQTSQGPEDQ